MIRWVLHISKTGTVALLTYISPKESSSNNFETSDDAQLSQPPEVQQRKRQRRLPTRLKDYIPHGDGKAIIGDFDDHGIGTLSDSDFESRVDNSPEDRRRLIHLVFRRWRTKTNKFGSFKEYLGSVASQEGIHSLGGPTSATSSQFIHNDHQLSTIQEALGPFQNYSELAFAQITLCSAGVISNAFCDRFTNELLGDPLVCPKDLVNLKTSHLAKLVAAWDPPASIPSGIEDYSGTNWQGWKSHDVIFEVPFGRKAESFSGIFTVSNLFSRNLIETIHWQIEKIPASQFNIVDLIPHYHYHTSGISGDKERVIDHPMCSDYMISEYQSIQALPRQECDTMERVILGLQLWSDATRLANFGPHKLWPVYACFAHTPLWERENPQTDAWFDVAHLPTVRKYFMQNILSGLI
jgi:hypothetical protein